MNKKELKAHLIEVHEHVIADLRTEMMSYHQSADLDEEDTLDPEDYSHQTESGRVALNLEVQIRKAEEDLALLKSLDESPKVEVAPGALIQLDDRYLYVSIAGLPIQYEGSQVLSISTEAPIYPLIRSKKAGDTIKLGKEEHRIINIS